jgi:hypothetical protein
MSAKKVAQEPSAPMPIAVNGASSEPPIDVFTMPAPTSDVTDDFDLDSFRASPEPLVAPVNEGVAAARVRKPRGTDFVFMHPEWRELIWVIPDDFERRREAHLVLPAIAARHLDICRKVLLVPYCSDDNNYYLWPVLQEDASGRINGFNKSAMQQIARSKGRWSQFVANMGNQSYTLYDMTDQREAPTWPAGGIRFLIKTAFEDRIIAAHDHPLFRQLRGRKVD